MTDKQINHAIAEACGWRKEDGVYMWTANGIDCTCPELWDWCNDLNAMHQAEQQLWRKDWNLRYDYVDELGKILNPTVWHRMNATDMLDATARERAEAFLRTLGKWEEMQT